MIEGAVLKYFVLGFDFLLITIALVDYFISRKLPEDFEIKREFARRFAIGDENTVNLRVENNTCKSFHMQLKDEFPPEMVLNEEDVCNC